MSPQDVGMALNGLKLCSVNCIEVLGVLSAMDTVVLPGDKVSFIVANKCLK